MITAKEARVLSDRADERLRIAAEKWVEGELEFIEDHIRKAAVEEGEYCTSYFWSAGIFQDAGIREEDTRVFLKNALQEAGYNCKITIVKQSYRERMIVDIDWGEGNNE